MTRLQKDSRYTHKNLVNKREEKSLRMKLLVEACLRQA